RSLWHPQNPDQDPRQYQPDQPRQSHDPEPVDVADARRGGAAARSDLVMDLKTVHQGVHKLKRKKRVGRGPGRGHGKTATRGNKGQWASAGANMPIQAFEGGQMPLFRRIPKRGFSHATWDRHYLVVNVGDLDQAFAEGATIDQDALRKAGLAKGA